MAMRHPSSGATVGAVELEERRDAYPAQVASVPPPGFVAEGVPIVSASVRPYAYVGIPIDSDEASSSSYSPRFGPSTSGRMAAGGDRVHGDVNLGVGRDLTGAEEAARESARRDNAAFVENKGFTEAQARARVEEDLRAIEIARINAKRRDAEGLDMRPHPGNRLEKERSYDAAKTKESDYEAARTVPLAGKGGAGGGGKAGGRDEEEAVSSSSSGASGGYQCAEYTPMEYDVSEYKSIYSSPPRK